MWENISHMHVGNMLACMYQTQQGLLQEELKYNWHMVKHFLKWTLVSLMLYNISNPELPVDLSKGLHLYSLSSVWHAEYSLSSSSMHQPNNVCTMKLQNGKESKQQHLIECKEFIWFENTPIQFKPHMEDHRGLHPRGGPFHHIMD